MIKILQFLTAPIILAFCILDVVVIGGVIYFTPPDTTFWYGFLLLFMGLAWGGFISALRNHLDWLEDKANASSH